MGWLVLWQRDGPSGRQVARLCTVVRWGGLAARSLPLLWVPSEDPAPPRGEDDGSVEDETAPEGCIFLPAGAEGNPLGLCGMVPRTGDLPVLPHCLRCGVELSENSLALFRRISPVDMSPLLSAVVPAGL